MDHPLLHLAEDRGDVRAATCAPSRHRGLSPKWLLDEGAERARALAEYPSSACRKTHPTSPPGSLRACRRQPAADTAHHGVLPPGIIPLRWRAGRISADHLNEAAAMQPLVSLETIRKLQDQAGRLIAPGRAIRIPARRTPRNKRRRDGGSFLAIQRKRFAHRSTTLTVPPRIEIAPR